MRIKENHHAAEEEKTRERSVKVLLSGMFSRKKKKKEKEKERSSQPHEDSRLVRRDKTNKNMHMSLTEMMRKLKHSFKKDNPQHDKKRLLVHGKKKGMRISTTTKDHFFLERMTSISQKRFQQHHHVIKEKHKLLSENGDSNQNLARSEKEAQGRMVTLLPGYSSPFRSPGKIWDMNPTLLTRSASDNFMKSETLAEIESASLSQDSSSPSMSSSSHNFVTFEISELEASDVEKEEVSSHEESLPQSASPSHYISTTDEYKLVLEPLFIQYEISPSRGEEKRQTLCNQFEEKDVPMDEKETVFKYVKAVLDAIDLSWEDMYLKTKFSDQILNPALFSNIPLSPSQLCAADHNHELLFDSINELIFELCRFPQWVVSFVKPRTQVLSFSGESIVHKVQKEVYCRLFPLQFADSVDQIVKEDMDKRGSWWLDVRCEVECIGFETSELILNELLEQLILDLCR